MELSGIIIEKMPIQTGTSKTGNDWTLQPYVMQTIAEYPKKVAFEVFGTERIERNEVNVGDNVTISFDIESREFNGRWYTSVRAWKVEKASDEAAAQPIEATDAQPIGDVIEKMQGKSELPF